MPGRRPGRTRTRPHLRWPDRRGREPLTFDGPASGPVMSDGSGPLGLALFVPADGAREREGWRGVAGGRDDKGGATESIPARAEVAG